MRLDWRYGIWIFLSAAFAAMVIASCSSVKQRHAYEPFGRDALLNAETKLESLEQKKVKLSDGARKEKAGDAGPGMRVQLSDHVQHADVDGDGSMDAVGIAYVDSGGSGAFAELVTWLNRDGKPESAPGVVLGDRVGLKSLKLTEGRAEVQLVVHGSKDPMCCPTQFEKRAYLWKKDHWERDLAATQTQKKTKPQKKAKPAKSKKKTPSKATKPAPSSR